MRHKEPIDDITRPIEEFSNDVHPIFIRLLALGFAIVSAMGLGLIIGAVYSGRVEFSGLYLIPLPLLMLVSSIGLWRFRKWSVYLIGVGGLFAIAGWIFFGTSETYEKSSYFFTIPLLVVIFSCANWKSFR